MANDAVLMSSSEIFFKRASLDRDVDLESPRKLEEENNVVGSLEGMWQGIGKFRILSSRVGLSKVSRDTRASSLPKFRESKSYFVPSICRMPE